MTALNKQALREAAQEEIMLRSVSDTSDAWQDEASQEAVLALLDELEKTQAQSSKWCEAFHKAVSVGARYEERIAELESLTASMEQEPVAWIGVNMLKGMQDECRQSGRVWVDDTGLGNCTPLYAATQLPHPEPEEIAMQNFRAAMEGIVHIRRTLDETFGGLHGTHCEPDVLVECKEICDAIYEAYRKTAPVTPDEMTPQQASRSYGGEVRGYRDGWNAFRAAMLQGAEPVTTAYKLPEGWVAVPVDATRAMIDAARSVEEDGYDAMHKAMLAAAPQQEVKHG